MRFLIDTLMIFFGTLIAAALVALGEPAETEATIAHATAPEKPSPQHAAVQARPGRGTAVQSLR